MLANRNIFSAVQTVLFIVWTAIILIQVSCKVASNQNNDKSITALRLYSSFPILDDKNNPVKFIDTLMVLEYEDKVMYQIPVDLPHSRITLNKDLDIIKDTILKVDVRNQYFLYRQGAISGWLYDSLTASTGRKVSVDSVLSAKTITVFEKFFIKKRANDSLINSWWSHDSSTLIERYLPRIKKDLSYSDSTILFFTNKLAKYHFSLSKTLDSFKGMKLYQVRIVYNQKPQVQDPYGRLGKEIIFKIEEGLIPHKDKVFKLFKKFDKDSMGN